MRLAPVALLVLACGSSDVSLNQPAGGGAGGAGGATGGGSTGGGGGGGGSGGGSGGGTAGGQAGCSPTTCPSGCCGTLNNCLPGTSNTACGTMGAVCVSCMSGQTCSAGRRCEVPFDPNMMFSVRPVSARVAPTAPGGGAWDDLSDPDCGIELWCPASAANVTGTADHVNDTFTPSWTGISGTCRITAGQLVNTGFAFRAYESDLLSDDTITARTVVLLTEAELMSGTKTLTGAGGLTSITFQLTP